MAGYTVGVIGATGAVGREFLRVMEERAFPVRVALVVDGSMTATAVDPGARRADALQEITGYSDSERQQVEEHLRVILERSRS